ncbi:MAG TPA: PEP-CTERM sorting domain-containing protein [Gemmatimonadales bacterium]
MRRSLLASALALSFAVGTVEAQIGTREFTLNRAWGWNATSGTTSHGYYVGPYGGSSPGLPQLDVYCVDFLNGVSLNDTWTARFTSLADLINGDGLGYTRFGQRYIGGDPGAYPDPVIQYQKAAWLALQFEDASTGSWGGIHQAIWNQFTSSPSWTDVGGAYWRYKAGVAAGDGSFDNINWNYWYVVTDVTTGDVKPAYGGRQEYLTYVTPEPETLFLMATGLVAVIGYAVVSRRFV